MCPSPSNGMGPLPRAEPLRPQSLDVELLRAWPMRSDVDDDKFARGTVLVIGGSTSTPGAVILAGVAALRAGAGRLQIATAPEVACAVAIAVPESKVVAMTTEELSRSVPDASCVLVGPGLPADDRTVELVRNLCEMIAAESIVVLDAAAIQAIAAVESTVRDRLRGRIVLTPNRQELDELLGNGAADGGAAAVGEAAERFGAVVTSFGTVRTADGAWWETSVGHPALGTSGSGDVRAGLIAGVAARTRRADQAACWGTLLHALAGERLGAHIQPLGFPARELIDAVTGVVESQPLMPFLTN
jgi:ADP-dependent NAD(P)H-hydrate dehydratase